MEQFIQKITRQAAGLVLRHFGKDSISYVKKDITDVVTEADLRANKFLVNAIKQRYPTHGIISEELGAHQIKSDYIWYIDPLDGSSNFAAGIPLFAVMVAYAYKGRVKLAAVAAPALNQFYFAQRKGGAYLNGRRIRCSQKKAWMYSYGCTGARMTSKRLAYLKHFAKEAKKGAFWLSAYGSTGVTSCFVAAGMRDWYFSAGNHSWDYAAPALLLSEAGCKVTNAKGKSWTLGDITLAAANPILHKRLMRIVNPK